MKTKKQKVADIVGAASISLLFLIAMVSILPSYDGNTATKEERLCESIGGKYKEVIENHFRSTVKYDVCFLPEIKETFYKQETVK